MRAMILAAGRGERMGELTADRPKPLLEIAGASLIEHQIERLVRAGIREIVVNLSYRGAQLRRHVGDGSRWNVSIVFSEEGEPPLETGGGIVQALPLLGTEPFLLVNADVYTHFDYGALLEPSRRQTLVLVPNPSHHPHGDFGLDDAGQVTAGPPRLTYAGIAVLSPNLFADLPRGRRPLKPSLDAAIERGELDGMFFDGLWFDVGTPERLAAARAAASRR